MCQHHENNTGIGPSLHLWYLSWSNIQNLDCEFMLWNTMNVILRKWQSRYIVGFYIPVQYPSQCEKENCWSWEATVYGAEMFHFFFLLDCKEMHNFTTREKSWWSRLYFYLFLTDTSVAICHKTCPMFFEVSILLQLFLTDKWYEVVWKADKINILFK